MLDGATQSLVAANAKAVVPVPKKNLELKYLLCGAVAGAVSRTATAPLDRIKVHLQTQTGLSLRSLRGAVEGIIAQASRPTSAALSSTSNSTIAGNGRTTSYAAIVRSFWRGNGLNCIKIVPEYAIRFFIFEAAKVKLGIGTTSQQIGMEQKNPGSSNPDSNVNSNSNSNNIGKQNLTHHGPASSAEHSLRVFAAGGAAGFVSQLLVYPLETIKTRTMASSGRCSATCGQEPGYIAISRQMITLSREEGERGGTASGAGEPDRPRARRAGTRLFFRGLAPSLFGIVPYAGIELGMYEWLRPKAPPKNAADAAHLLLVGSAAAGVAAVTVYPLSLVRTRLQAQGTPGHPQTYTGFLDVVARTWRAESLRGFYKGLAPTLLKVIPSAAVNYLCYEEMKTLFST